MHEVSKVSDSSPQRTETGPAAPRAASRRVGEPGARQEPPGDRVEHRDEAEKEGVSGVLAGLQGWLHETREQPRERWHDVGDVRQNLRRNGDLSTYSSQQLLALDGLSDKHPSLARQVENRTEQTVKQADDVGDLPRNLGFQVLLQNQPLDEKTEGHLDRLVENYVNDRLDQRLEGQEGDDAAQEAGQKWGRDIRAQMARDPALSSRLATSARELSQEDETKGRLQDVAEADDSFFTRAIRDTGNFLGDGLEDALKLPIPGNPVGMLSLTSGAADAVGFDAGADFTRDVQGGLINSARGTVTGTANALADPVGTGKGLVELGRHGAHLANPANLIAESALRGESSLDVLGEDASFFRQTGEASLQSYQDTAQEYGVVGAITHGATDLAMTLAPTGAARAPALLERMPARVSELKAQLDEAPALGKEAASTAAAGANTLDDYSPEQALEKVSRQVRRGEGLPRRLRELILAG